MSSGLFNITLSSDWQETYFIPLLLTEQCRWSASPFSLSSFPSLPDACLPLAPPASLGLYLEEYMDEGEKHF